jgi:hypothetical protein
VCFAHRGKELLDEAIEIGTLEFENECSDNAKADFAQQLANRHFNRGVLLLLTQNDPCAPPEARVQGYEDLLKARQLDCDVRDFWLQKKLMLKNSAEYFERMVRRLRGLVDLHGDEGVRNVWDVTELVEDLDRLLFAAWDQPNAPLFRDVTRVGRLQQLEDVVIRLEMSQGNYVEAASLGVRMLVEDDHMIEPSFLSSANALLTCMKLDQPSTWSPHAKSLAKGDLRKILKNCKGQTFDAGKCLLLCLELSDKWKDDEILAKINSNCLLLYDENFNDDDYVGLVSFSDQVENELRMELSRKAQLIRDTIEFCTKTTCGSKGYPTIPVAIQMVVDAAESRENDTFIVAVIDGSSWGSFSATSIRRQIDRLNRERTTVINVIIIGLDLRDSDIVDECRALCLVSRGSTFLEATVDTVDGVFDQVTSIITGRSAASGSILGGITMEKF